MNSVLQRRFIAYCAAALVTFALVFGGIFEWRLRVYTREAAAADLIRHAEAVAALLSSDDNDVPSEAAPQKNIRGRGVGCRPMMQGRGAAPHHFEQSGMNRGHAYCRQVVDGTAANGLYLRQLEPLAGGAVWLVDRESRTITLYGDAAGTSFDELPDAAEALLDTVFAGGTAASQAFDPLLDAPSVTAGAPIRNATGDITGAVLLHRTLSAALASERHGRQLLLAAAVTAFLLALGLSFLLGRRFLRPLARMEKTAAALAEGDYSARTGVMQSDEVGSLAESLDALALCLAHAAQESARLTQMRQDFLASVSHELRTPLTVLRGSLDLFAAGLCRSEEERQRYLAQMAENVRQLERLVGDLFELTRLQNMDFRMEKSPASVTDALTDAIRSARRLAAPRAITISCPALPPIILDADYGRLRQMFLIVLDNAIKFSPDGAAVEVSAAIDKTGWRVTVRDHGCGIAPEELPHIFERFHRQTGSANSGGTGLGLAVAQAIAARHDITITAANPADGGACFTFHGTTPPKAPD